MTTIAKARNQLTLRRGTTLKKEVVPFTRTTALHRGLAWVENPDPILRNLAATGDESTYRMMVRSEPVLYAEIEKRCDTLLAPGWKLIPGESKSETAMRNWRFAKAFLRKTKGLETVLRRMLDARYWGWRPMERTWSTDETFEGSPAWFVTSIKEKYPEDFRFTKDRELAWIRDSFSDPQIMNKPLDHLKWWTLSSGSTDNPYGNAILMELWLIWYIKSRYTESWSIGMNRSMGILKASESLEGADKVTGEPGISSGKTFAEAQAELMEIINHLNTNNVLIQKDGWVIDFLNNVAFAEGWKEPLQYSDNLMAMAISTEPGAMRSGSIGSRSALETTRKSLVDRAKEDGKWQEDQLGEHIRLGIEVNFGLQEDEDLPSFLFKLGRRAEMEEIQQLANMGAPVDLREVAKDRHIPIVDENPDEPMIATPTLTVQRNQEDSPDPGNVEDEPDQPQPQRG